MPQRIISPALRLAAVAVCAATTTSAWAWPTQPIQIVVGFPPGGGADVLARALAESMARSLGQSVIVANRDGAAGTLAMQTVAKATADGYTLGFGPVGPLVLQPHLKANLPYKVDDVVGVCQTFVNHYAIVASPSSRYKTLGDAITEARQKPDELAYGTGGMGSLPHLAAVQLITKAGVKMRAVPYRGDPPLMIALKGGEIELGTAAVGLAQAQGLRLLGVFSPTRVAEAPQVPTMTELGYPVVSQLFGGLVAPRNTPEPVLKALQSACEAGTHAEKYVAAARSTQQDIVFKPAADFTKAIAAEFLVQRDAVKAANFKPE